MRLRVKQPRREMLYQNQCSFVNTFDVARLDSTTSMSIVLLYEADQVMRIMYWNSCDAFFFCVEIEGPYN